MDSYNSPTTKVIFRANQAVWYILALLETVLIFRFILKLLGANPEAGFTKLIYSISFPLTSPFLSVFRATATEGSILEGNTLLAMFVYWLLAAGIVQLLTMSKTVSTPEAARKLEKEEA